MRKSTKMFEDIQSGVFKMLLNVRIENFLVYSASVDFSLLADKKRRFDGSIAKARAFPC